MTPFPQDVTNPYSLSTFTLPLRPRPNGGSSSSGGCSGGDRHVESRHQEQQVVQTTTTTTTTTSRTTATGPRHGNMDKDRDRDILLNPVSASAVMGPRSPIHNCSSSSCSDFSTVASKTATRAGASRHSKPASSISISEVSSESGGTGGGASPNLKKYLRTRRGAISGPSCPGPAPGPGPLSLALTSASPAPCSRSSWRSSSSRPSRSRAYGGERLLLPAPSMGSGSFASGSDSGLGSEMSGGTTGSRAGGRTGSTTGATTNRLNQARLFPFSPRGWPDHNRNGSQIITDPAGFPDSSSVVSNESSSSINTVRLLDLHTSPPPPPSASLRISASRLSHNPRIRTGEITPGDSISQIGSSASASASASSSTLRRNGGQRSSLSLPIRSLPLRGVRHVSASEIELSPRIRLEEEDRWILPSSPPGRFGPPPLSAFGSGSSRDSSPRDYRKVVVGSSKCSST
ncbi:hypothetical protein NEUTE1DRAFT_126604 [Neurospora tetrasperma FGSC 2508]|uniref:Uncharacterized protein n=1 Tax=Neurospora tetrasperma (strain FGSC 2508 / ATCC MYA-4615 / P0657) TaxID=510951 RepID=F8N288_NEUT8|nr:uncharacterized protein NEUTE1DRAFT_126604 [Neurospora tetrasperma FGSC 2508]EGO53259.1 hypothetical protein NEUTE1DRAFT_126604 [Neurospora tetrasperma FGSC 2508]